VSLQRAVDGLDGRVSELDRELRAAFTSELGELRNGSITDLKNSQIETRGSAHQASKRASEALNAVTALRGEVDRLGRGLDSLREDVGEVLALLRGTTPAAAESRSMPAAAVPAVNGTHEVSRAADGNGMGARQVAVLPAQRHEPVDESLPAAPERQAEEEGAAPAHASPVPGFAASTATEPEPAEGTATPEEEAARAERPPEPEPEPEPEPDKSVTPPHPSSEAGRIWAIMKANRVASATLICHRDTWDFVAEHAGRHPHFRSPTVEERDGGMVAAVLSGRSMVAVLLALYPIARAPRSSDETERQVTYADWAMASAVYHETVRVLYRTRPGSDGDPVVITIDRSLPTHP
jgi:hypothetical protein